MPLGPLVNREESIAWCKKYDRHYCCKETPWNGQGRAMHEEVKEIADYGDSVRNKCLVCGATWNKELP